MLVEVKYLLKYFVEEKVILPREAENITVVTSSKRATELLLTNISAPLQAGFKDCSANFYKLLNILKQRGTIAAVQLCNEIEKKLLTTTSDNQVSSKECSNNTSTVKCTEIISLC